MEIQVQELIEQIKREGVEAAEAEAAAIVAAAKAKAADIVAAAEAEAEKRLLGAKRENERMVTSSEEAIRQAGRNLLISFRESVARELRTIVGEQVNAVYSSEAFATLIVTAVEHWVKQPDADELEVILNETDRKTLEDTLLAQFKAKALGGVTLKTNHNLDGGFRIAAKDGGAYYDYSADAVCDMLSNYLSPKVTALLKEAE